MKYYRALQQINAGKGQRYTPGTVLSEEDLGFPAEQVPSLIEVNALEEIEEGEAKKLLNEQQQQDPQPSDSQITPDPFSVPAEPGVATPPPSVVDINTATEEELILLPAIGKSVAQKLIKARPFKSLEEAQKASGLKPDQWVSLSGRVTVEPVEEPEE